MISQESFSRWFNRSFWNAFKNLAFPIKLPRERELQKQLVTKVFQSITSARYAPSVPEIELVANKGYGVARTIPVFCIEDYCVYYFCIKELENILCVNRTPNTFGGWRLGGKLRKKEHDDIESELTEYGRYSFNPHAWKEVFGEFNSLLFSQIGDGKYSHVLQVDLSNFYDSVRLDILERWIREESDCTRGWVITLLFYLLNQWNRRNTGLHPQAVGLPQDALADCSRILANFYLQKYDKFASAVCASEDALYFRYADDQMILTNHPEQVERLLLLLTRHLDRYGLRVNQKKVQIWTARDLEKHRCRNIQSIFAQKGDNQNIKLVKEFVMRYLAIPQSELEKSWNQGLPLLNRLLFSNLELLPNQLFTRIVQRFMTDSYLLRADHKKLERVAILAHKNGKQKELLAKLSTLLKTCVHNAFHYEVRTFAIQSKVSELEGLGTSKLNDLADLMHQAEHPDLIFTPAQLGQVSQSGKLLIA